MVSFELIDNNIGVIRQRARSAPSYWGSPFADDEKKYHGRRRRRYISAGKLFITIIQLSLLAAICLGIMRRHRWGSGVVKSTTSTANNSTQYQAESTAETAKAKVNPSKSSPKKLQLDWSHCKEPLPKKDYFQLAEKKVEPLWLPAYPTALPMEPYSNLITALTGVQNGAKTYYRQSPALRRCHYKQSSAKVQSVTCEIVHPIVPANRPSPAQQKDDFGNVVLLALRNPMTAFPSHHQSKAEAYHGQQGQVDKEKWIEFRDKYVGNGDENSHLFQEFKTFVTTWREMLPYHVAEYLPFENWIDEIKGPAMVKRLSQVLGQEGFPGMYDAEADSKDLGCIWYIHVYQPMVEEEKKRADWYEWEFTKEQLLMMAYGLEKFANEIKDKSRPSDEQLIDILNDYSNTIREKVV